MTISFPLLSGHSSSPFSPPNSCLICFGVSAVSIPSGNKYFVWLTLPSLPRGSISEARRKNYSTPAFAAINFASSSHLIPFSKYPTLKQISKSIRSSQHQESLSAQNPRLFFSILSKLCGFPVNPSPSHPNSFSFSLNQSTFHFHPATLPPLALPRRFLLLLFIQKTFAQFPPIWPVFSFASVAAISFVCAAFFVRAIGTNLSRQQHQRWTTGRLCCCCCASAGGGLRVNPFNQRRRRERSKRDRLLFPCRRFHFRPLPPFLPCCGRKRVLLSVVTAQLRNGFHFPQDSFPHASVSGKQKRRGRDHPSPDPRTALLPFLSSGRAINGSTALPPVLACCSPRFRSMLAASSPQIKVGQTLAKVMADDAFVQLRSSSKCLMIAEHCSARTVLGTRSEQQRPDGQTAKRRRNEGAKAAGDAC